MTPQELRTKLEEGGIPRDTEFETLLNSLIEFMMKLEDPPINDYGEEEKHFVLGFCTGANAMGIFMEDVNKRFMQ